MSELHAAQMLSDHDLDVIFRQARTHSHWQEKPVPDVLLEAAYDLARMGPTASNCQPMRVVFIKTPEAKARLKPILAAGNVEKTMTAPVTALVGYDLEFYEHLPVLFPHVDARSWFVGNEPLIAEAGFRNGSLQAAYLIIALRALGLDCGPMSGFDQDKATAEFFAGTKVKANFLINIGYGVPDKLFPRGPRLDFTQACKII